MLKATAAIEDIMEVLGLAELPEGCPYRAVDDIGLNVSATQGEIDENASEPDPERIATNPRDLRDGLQAILVGDNHMASTLLARAFHDDPEAARIVEEVLR
ncbi:hypothetical protein OMP43_21785 [Sphingomonas sp. CBMAI 2297]|uniref:hypothetical protein n=1 Tax=Sphingomonas sp. CBMAI 2297 TaxID=2991720 RepID=UPI0024590DE1|nr:hypothetical protein [Sphingomonas sp. CBMAI 2297]MDH4746662.1 hypothetical protein [Sphingomonas sp. CBMAI 2297]